jgi:hypothetical protein
VFARAARIADSLPAVPAGTSPWVAFLLGFLLGGVGLAFYLRSWAEGLILCAFWLALIMLPGDGGFWLGALAGGVWGLVRVWSGSAERVPYHGFGRSPGSR